MSAAASAIVIQRFEDAHVEGVTALYNDPAVCRQVLQLPYQSSDVWRERLVTRSERSMQLVALQEGRVIGNIGLEQYPRVRRSHAGWFGMGIAAAWQGQGLGSRLMAQMLDVADNWMNLRRVELTVFCDNEAAHGLYRKFGFETEGRLRNYALRDGVFVDVLSMARLR